jgi:hypothetical protein
LTEAGKIRNEKKAKRKNRVEKIKIYAGLTHVYSEGEKVMFTVMRGQEKITKEVTLEAMK